MLRLCQMYQQVHGPEVPVSPAFNCVPYAHKVARPSHSDPVSTVKSAVEKAKPLPSTTTSNRKAMCYNYLPS